MTCPNCGAELERHSFTNVCKYCGYVSPIGRNVEHSAECLENIRQGAQYYDYIVNNLSYLESHSKFVKVSQQQSIYTIVCAKPFHPYDKHYQLCDDIAFAWQALISKEKIILSLLVVGKALPQTISVLLDNDITLIFHQLNYSSSNVYSVALEDFLTLCDSDKINFDFPYIFDEFLTYSRRFYNLAFKRTKYLYSINQILLTD